MRASVGSYTGLATSSASVEEALLSGSVAASGATTAAAVLAAIDAGGVAGSFVILDADSVALCAFDLAYPCGTVAAGVLTIDGFPASDLDPEESGTAASAELRDSDGNVARALTVGTASADVLLESIAIRSGYPVVMQSATYTETE